MGDDPLRRNAPDGSQEGGLEEGGPPQVDPEEGRKEPRRDGPQDDADPEDDGARLRSSQGLLLVSARA